MMEKKPFFLQKISEYNHTIEKITASLNGPDAIMVLLSMYEVHSFEIQDIRKTIRNGRVEQRIPLEALYLNNIIIQTSVLKALEYILKIKKYSKSILDQIPVIHTLSVIGITNPYDLDVQQKLKDSSDFDDEKDTFVGNNFELLGGKHKGMRLYVIKKFHELAGNDQIVLSFELFKKFEQKQIYETYLRSSKNVEVDTDGKTKFVNITINDFINRVEIHPRTFGENPQFPFWNPALKDDHVEVEKTYDKGNQSPEHQAVARKQVKNIFNEFAKIPQFEESFKKYSSLPFDKHASLMEELLFLTYETGIMQVRLEKTDLISKLQKITTCTEYEISSFIENNTWTQGNSPFKKPLIFDGLHYHFTHGLLLSFLTADCEKCYVDLINNHAKGTHFEKECREIFKNNSCYVLEDSIKIHEPIMPPEESIKLWHFVKDQPDFDVVGIKQDILFIVECKTRKHDHKIDKHTIDVLQKSYVETYYKAKWIAENYQKFLQKVENQGFTIPNKCKYVVPLFACNLSKFEIPNTNPISLLELREILQKINTPLSTEFKILFDSGIEEQFISLEIQDPSLT